MITANMQPYFFPNLNHFSMIDYADKWIVFDDTQYRKQSWINRNRILHPISGEMYIHCPINSVATKTKINEVKRKLNLNFILGQLSHYKKAPYYMNVIEIIRNIYLNNDKEFSLAKFNVMALKKISDYINIEFNYTYSSELNITYPKKMNPGDWSLEITKFLGSCEYVNPISGKNLFDLDKFKKYNIKIKFFDFENPLYDTGDKSFIPGLSIIDTMMWLPPEKINFLLKKNRIIVE